MGSSNSYMAEYEPGNTPESDNLALTCEDEHQNTTVSDHFQTPSAACAAFL